MVLWICLKIVTLKNSIYKNGVVNQRAEKRSSRGREKKILSRFVQVLLKAPCWYSVTTWRVNNIRRSKKAQKNKEKQKCAKVARPNCLIHFSFTFQVKVHEQRKVKPFNTSRLKSYPQNDFPKLNSMLKKS